MSTPLLALGSHIFTIPALNYQELQRDTEAKWVAVPRFGGRPGRQFVGFGEDTIRISGLMYPDDMGGRSEFEALRATQSAAQPVLMMGWSSADNAAALLFGRVVILRVSDTQSRIGNHGMGRRLEYDIEVAPFSGEGQPLELFL